MVNIKELRIGNFVLLDGLVPDKENDGEHYNECDYAEIWGTDTNGRAEVSWDIPYKANCICWQDDEALLPIAITAAWLEKFGYKREDAEHRLGPSKGSIIWRGPVDLISRDGNFAYFHECSDPYYDCEGIEIKFIHQLQNLVFALTGEGLEVRLLGC